MWTTFSPRSQPTHLLVHQHLVAPVPDPPEDIRDGLAALRIRARGGVKPLGLVLLLVPEGVGPEGALGARGPQLAGAEAGVRGVAAVDDADAQEALALGQVLLPVGVRGVWRLWLVGGGGGSGRGWAAARTETITHHDQCTDPRSA